MLLLPLWIALAVLVNLLVIPRNLVRALSRRPRWIRLRFDGGIGERPAPRRRWWLPSRGEPSLSIADLESLGELLARDDKAVGVLLEIEGVHAGWARIESARAAIASWRKSGKKVVAHLSSPGNAEVYLALACDEILVDESGPVGLIGVKAEVGFYGEALRRHGVDPELERIGDYKSYADTFMRGDMSAAHREATDLVLDGIAAQLVRALVEFRTVDAIDAGRAQAIVDGGPYNAQDALAAGLVNGVVYRDEVPARIGEKESRIGSLDSYRRARPSWWVPPVFRRKRAIAVLSLEGNIVPGEGTSFLMKTVGADAAVRALDRLRENKRVAAVVLHVDSRGGSAAASDLIWRAVTRLAKDKPVVAYLGDAAASGGYYIVAPCAHIVAQPTTLTGSIGVVGGKFSVERLLERLGVGTEILTRGRAAAMTTIRRRFDDAGRARLKSEIASTYQQFVKKVAEGRKLEEPAVDAVARGRVWLGRDAHPRKLVDKLGGLRDAIAEARVRAKVKKRGPLQVVDVHPSPKRQGGGLISMLGGANGVRVMLEEELAVWRALAKERALLWADDLPEID